MKPHEFVAAYPPQSSPDQAGAPAGLSVGGWLLVVIVAALVSAGVSVGILAMTTAVYRGDSKWADGKSGASSLRAEPRVIEPMPRLNGPYFFPPSSKPLLPSDLDPKDFELKPFEMPEGVKPDTFVIPVPDTNRPLENAPREPNRLDENGDENGPRPPHFRDGRR